MDTDGQESTSSKSTANLNLGGSRKLCDAFIELEIGAILEYERISEIIGRDPQENGRSICLRAAELALRNHGIKIVCEISRGYKRVGFEGRREWITAKGEQVQRVNVRRFVTASHIEQREFEAMTDNEKQQLAQEQTRVGMNLAIAERLNRCKNLPSVERIKLVDLSSLGQVFRKVPKAF